MLQGFQSQSAAPTASGPPPSGTRLTSFQLLLFSLALALFLTYYLILRISALYAIIYFSSSTLFSSYNMYSNLLSRLLLYYLAPLYPRLFAMRMRLPPDIRAQTVAPLTGYFIFKIILIEYFLYKLFLPAPITLHYLGYQS